MKSVEFTTTIKKNLIRLPANLSVFDDRLVRVQISEKSDDNLNGGQIKNLLNLLDTFKKEPIFKEIIDPILWQKQLRDEWE